MSAQTQTTDFGLTPERLGEINRGLRYRKAGMIAGALWPLAQRYGISRLAKDVGISRAHMYRLFSEDANPELKTMLNIMETLGVSVVAAATASMPEDIEA
ncbi:MAG: helix-turn-helix domain-containing protein [Caulobacteraceae bacterium]|nr:helix-turn-helix domain-containing protein [Caulobacteraceae bacterium]